MSVKLRMKRQGNRNRPFYRVTAVDSRAKRDGRVIEQLGFYNPLSDNGAGEVSLDLERCKYWLSVGAQPSETVAGLLRKQGLNPKAGTPIESQPAAEAASAEA